MAECFAKKRKKKKNREKISKLRKSKILRNPKKVDNHYPGRDSQLKVIDGELIVHGLKSMEANLTFWHKKL